MAFRRTISLLHVCWIQFVRPSICSISSLRVVVRMVLWRSCGLIRLSYVNLTKLADVSFSFYFFTQCFCSGTCFTSSEDEVDPRFIEVSSLIRSCSTSVVPVPVFTQISLMVDMSTGVVEQDFDFDFDVSSVPSVHIDDFLSTRPLLLDYDCWWVSSSKSLAGVHGDLYVDNDLDCSFRFVLSSSRFSLTSFLKRLFFGRSWLYLLFELIVYVCWSCGLTDKQVLSVLRVRLRNRLAVYLLRVFRRSNFTASRLLSVGSSEVSLTVEWPILQACRWW